MSRIIDSDGRRQAAGGISTRIHDGPTVGDLRRQRGERPADAVQWSFEQAFEQACADVQSSFRSRHEVKGLLLIGLKTGLLVATPFAWANEGEKIDVHERVARRYQGQAEYYVHATELPSGGRGAALARLVRVFGMNRKQTTLSRCWQIEQDPVPRLVEHYDMPSRRETLPEILFDRFR